MGQSSISTRKSFEVSLEWKLIKKYSDFKPQIKAYWTRVEALSRIHKS